MKRIVCYASFFLLLTLCAAAQSYTVTAIGLSGWEAGGLGINPQGNVSGELFANAKAYGLFWSPTQGALVLPTVRRGYSSYGTGINSKNVVCGFGTYNSTGRTHGLIWTNGFVQDLGTLPGGTTSWANGINSAGQIAGASDSSASGPHAITWSATAGMTDLGVLPGGIFSWGASINRFGQVVGYSLNVDSSESAFLWSKTNGMLKLASLPGGSESKANAINDLGEIVGTSGCGYNCLHAVLWGKTPGSILDLGTLPGSNGSEALGINDLGEVVGWTYSLGHAFLWTEATGMQDINVLIPADSGWTIVSATAINNRGQIIGQGQSCCGLGLQALLLTPAASARE